MAHGILQHFAATSAVLNGVAIPGRTLELTLARYAFNVFVLNDDETYPVSLRGTGTAMRFQENELLLCSQHQLSGIDRAKVGMMAEGGGRLVTSGGERHYSLSQDTDGYDLVAFNFTEPVAAHPEFRHRFFNLRWPTNLNTEIVGYLVTGCAYEDQSYDVAENNHIGVTRRSVVCDLDATQPSDPALVRLRSRGALSFDPDGMSGGSAFVVHQDGRGFWIDFAGVVIHGGVGGFEIIKAAFIYRFLQTCDWPAHPNANAATTYKQPLRDGGE